MRSDSNLVPECIVTPRSYGALMALYESNFIKLRRLIEVDKFSAGEHVARVDDGYHLCFSIQDQTRYTCSLRLTYLFGDEESVVSQPDLGIRVYLDARMVEVRSWAEHHRHDLLNTWHRKLYRELDRRWAPNMLLSKWLDYLLENTPDIAKQTIGPVSKLSIAS